MKKFWPAIFLSCSTVFSAAPLVRASFEETGIGARATALGGAFTAIADDVHAVYYNPAGLAQVQRKELSASYGLENTGLSDGSKISNSYGAYAHPFASRIGTIGLSWQQFTAENLYKERALSFAYGRKFARKIFLGAAVKHLSREFTAPVGTVDNSGFIDASGIDSIYAGGNSKSNAGLDLGILWKANDKYTVGAMVQDINEPDLALTGSSRDSAPMVIRSGIAYQERRFTLAGQLNAVKSAGSLNREAFAALACEKWVDSTRFTRGDLGFRGSFSAGPRSFSQVALGLSYRIGAIQMDYGFLMPLKGVGFGSSQGNHRMTLSFRFGNINPDSDSEIVTRETGSILKKSEQELEYYSRESAGTARELADRKMSAERAIEDIQSRRMSEGNAVSDKRIRNLFEAEMEWYWSSKSKGMPVGNRVKALAQILSLFAAHPLNFDSARKEHSVCASELARLESKFLSDWESYLRALSREVGVTSRVQMISDMISRYASAGVDLSRLKEEIKVLREEINPS